jgi:(p)ppGpp synthase/HD superfamily hydrolase
MSELEHELILSEKFTKAVDYARKLHTETRKGTQIPYMAHLLGVASLVMGEAGGSIPVTEEMVIAAVLHDTVEDHGGKRRLDDVGKTFGANVARMVEGLSDTLAEDHDKKEGWEDRKAAYLKKLHDEPLNVLLISAADKLYNAKAILDDYKEIGPEVWKRFKRGRNQQLWYFDSLVAIFELRMRSRLVDELQRVVAELAARSAGEGPGTTARKSEGDRM